TDLRMIIDLCSIVHEPSGLRTGVRPTLEAVLVALAVFVAIVVLALAHVAYWHRRFFVPADYEREQVLETEDGCTIVLRRLPRPDGEIVGPPVLMVHGLGANHRNNDLVPDHSIARHLRARGRDVWLL